MIFQGPLGETNLIELVMKANILDIDPSLDLDHELI